MKLELNQTNFKTEAQFLRVAIGNMIDLENATWLPTIQDDKIILVNGENHYEVKAFDHLKPAISNLIALSQAPESAFRGTLGKTFSVTNQVVNLEKQIQEPEIKVERRKSFVERIRERAPSTFQKQ